MTRTLLGPRGELCQDCVGLASSSGVRAFVRCSGEERVGEANAPVGELDHFPGDAVVPLGMVPFRLHLEVAESQVAKNLFDDFRHLLVLKNAAVRGQGQEPQPGDNFGPVVPTLVVVFVSRLEPADESVEMPRRSVRELGGKSHILSDDVLGSDVVLVREHVQLEREPAGHLLAARKGSEEEHVVSQRTFQSQHAGCLLQWHLIVLVFELSAPITCNQAAL